MIFCIAHVLHSVMASKAMRDLLESKPSFGCCLKSHLTVVAHTLFLSFPELPGSNEVAAEDKLGSLLVSRANCERVFLENNWDLIQSSHSRKTELSTSSLDVKALAITTSAMLENAYF